MIKVNILLFVMRVIVNIKVVIVKVVILVFW